MQERCSAILGLLVIIVSVSGEAAVAPPVRVAEYRLRLSISSPEAGRFEGLQTIALQQKGPRWPTSLELRARGLTVASVSSRRVGRNDTPCRFAQTSSGALAIQLACVGRSAQARLILRYRRAAQRGQSQQGIFWRVGARQVYTAFHTERWMPVLLDPAVRAPIRLTIVHDPSRHPVVLAPGRLLQQKAGVTTYLLRQSYPAYLYGFIVGRLTVVRQRIGGISFRFASGRHRPRQLKTIFADLPRMLRFFSGKAGMPLPARRFTFVLAHGRVAQELAEMALISERYGDSVLKNPREDWLIAHELAHQWWGNRVTIGHWRDFWLHEGLVTFLVAAYKEQRWGAPAYAREIALFQKRYRRRQRHGNERPLVVRGKLKPGWIYGGPITYAKGALVFHLLRRRLGERAFWAGIKAFTRASLNAPVDTTRMRLALERAAGRSLGPFFTRWVYGVGLPSPIPR